MTHTSGLLASLSSDISSLVATVAPHVVSVLARPHRPASGVAIGGDLVVTADHAVERDRDVTVIADGTRYDAALVGRDPAMDIAVLRVAGFEWPTLPTAPPPGAGALVVSVSRTFSGTVSAGLGVITSVGGPLRTARGVVLPAVIRTDAALRPGTSGGALVGADGRVVGLTTAGLLRGLPVAVPATEVADVARRLAARQPLGRGYLGVSVHSVTLAGPQRGAVPDGRGLLVHGVSADGAAEQAGLLVGDVLVRFNGHPIATAEDLQDSLAAVAPGLQTSVTVLRGGTLQDVAVTIGERPAA